MSEYKGDILNIMLCSSCNTHCKHCYISYKGNFDTKTLDELIANFKGKQITLNGTEPLMFPQYLKYFKQVRQDYIFTNSNIIYKNPLILDDIIANDIKKVCFSYHYKIQEQVSSIPLSQVEECVKMCLEKGLKVKLLCSVCKSNYKYLREFCEHALKLGASEILFTNFILQGNAIKYGFKELLLSDEELLFTLKEINEIRKLYDKNVLKIERCGSFANSIKSKNYLCDVGIKDVTITPDLKLYPCIFFAGMKEFEMGYYKDGKFIITRECNHPCDDCLAKQVFNDGKDLSYIFKKAEE